MTIHFRQQYFQQVDLLLTVLPIVATQSCFCLKGGTAINLFIRDLPRLSVDIDLVYIPINDRNTALAEIDQSLINIKHELLNLFPELNIFEKRVGRSLNKLFVTYNNIQITIEPNTILRGTLFPINHANLCQTAENLFEKTSADIPLLSSSEIYAGKICAALDRQHPRDLFDIKLLYENGGITDDIRKAFVVYLASSSRPMSELLQPNLLDISALYQSEFLGMTQLTIPLEALLNTRIQLINDINQTLTKNERLFLISVKEGEPNWDKLPFDQLNTFPALRWKLFNIQNMKKSKHQTSLNKLKQILLV